MAEEMIVVLCSLPGDAAAEQLAGILVEEKLAACVQVLPAMQSVFFWEGQVRVAAEKLLLCKTFASRYSALEQRLTALHPYDVPEILALPVTAALTSYRGWMGDVLRG
ncbi:divalent-cation tolerance protein CutA [Acidithiobacillus sp. AMEEHan]|uniref:divalent-cation tolerance protein CutA n=1 Tax=Acidithiobacillus sp. AMEEHan TaxID=2994951 RepID=UPI0027E4A034|nr:divalent-cation tolerance protein CutA [Acidithiobacillus sp. AMEEHan]